MSEKTIMLVCNAGMSTSMLVTKMQQAAEAQGLDVDIFAIAAAESTNTCLLYTSPSPRDS